MNNENFITITKDVLCTLRTLAEAGWQGLDCSENSLKIIESWTDHRLNMIETLEESKKEGFREP